jgi:hypothetical protein
MSEMSGVRTAESSRIERLHFNSLFSHTLTDALSAPEAGGDIVVIETSAVIMLFVDKSLLISQVISQASARSKGEKSSTDFIDRDHCHKHEP